MEIERVLNAIAHRFSDTKFVYQEKEVPKNKLMSFDGCLSVFVHKANLLSDFLFGHKLGVGIKTDPKTLTGERVELTSHQKPFIFVMMMYDTIEEMVANAGTGDVVLS